MIAVLATINEYGVPGILALMILKEVFSFVKGRNGHAKQNLCENLCGFEIKHANQISDVHNWNRPDPESGEFRTTRHARHITDAIKTSSKEVVNEIRALRKDAARTRGDDAV